MRMNEIDERSKAIVEDYQHLSKDGKDILKKLLVKTFGEKRSNEDVSFESVSSGKENQEPNVSCNQM